MAKPNALSSLKFDAGERLVWNAVGSLLLTVRQAQLLAPMMKHGDRRAHYREYIPGYDAKSWDERMPFHDSTRTSMVALRKRLRLIGIDIVTVHGEGFFLDELPHELARARVIYKDGYQALKEPPPAPAPKVSARAELSVFEKQRARALRGRGCTVMTIAAMLRKNYAAIEAATGRGV